MYLVTAKEMQKMDSMTIESFGLPGRVLMENAGKGAACFFCEFFSGSGEKKVGIFAGRGNNGGDGFVIARYIAENGFNVTVYLLAEKGRVKGNAKANLDLLVPLNIPVVEIVDKACF